MSDWYPARQSFHQEELVRFHELIDEFMHYAQSLSDADLAYLILIFDKVDIEHSPGYFLWQQLALTELRCRRSAQGKR